MQAQSSGTYIKKSHGTGLQVANASEESMRAVAEQTGEKPATRQGHREGHKIMTQMPTYQNASDMTLQTASGGPTTKNAVKGNISEEAFVAGEV